MTSVDVNCSTLPYDSPSLRSQSEGSIQITWSLASQSEASIQVTWPLLALTPELMLHWAIIAGVGPQFRVWAGQFCTSIKVYSTVSRLLNTSKENLVNKTGGVRNRVWVWTKNSYPRKVLKDLNALLDNNREALKEDFPRAWFLLLLWTIGRYWFILAGNKDTI